MDNESFALVRRGVAAAVMFFFVYGSFAQKKVAESSKRMNVLYIMSDDHTTQSIGAYEDRFAYLNPTPNIDALAKEGILFNNVFCNNAICTPSRASILTGQYSCVNGVLDLNGSLPVEKQYLPTEMNKAGYQTSIVGKWHLKEDPQAYQNYKVLIDQGTYFDPKLIVNYDTIGAKPERVLHEGGKYINSLVKQYKGHSTTVITDNALDWLQKERDKSKPFFFCLQYKAPHDLFEYDPKYENYMADVKFPEPENLLNQQGWGSEATRGKNDSLRRVIASSVGRRNLVRNMGKDLKIKDDKSLSDNEYTRLVYQEYMRRYFRCVKGIDDNLKRVFDYLKANGLWENTIIIYTADQGFFLGEHDLIDKRWMYEEAVRMPLIVRDPRTAKKGIVSSWMINNVDYAPTLLDFANVKKPSYMQGFSFKDALKGGQQPKGWRTSTYYRYYMHMAHHANPAQIGVRNKKFKLILFYGTDTRDDMNSKYKPNRFGFDTPIAWELYDLEKDPHENTNQYNNPVYKKTIILLKKELKRLMQENCEGQNENERTKKIFDREIFRLASVN
jgi:uncharacterized sulfatase